MALPNTKQLWAVHNLCLLCHCLRCLTVGGIDVGPFSSGMWRWKFVAPTGWYTGWYLMFLRQCSMLEHDIRTWSSNIPCMIFLMAYIDILNLFLATDPFKVKCEMIISDFITVDIYWYETVQNLPVQQTRLPAQLTRLIGWSIVLRCRAAASKNRPCQQPSRSMMATTAMTSP